MEYAIPLHHRQRAQGSFWRSVQRGLGAFIIGVFALATALSLASLLQPRGLQLIAVRSDSMGSTLPLGSVAFVTPAANYRAGEIVAYQPAGSDGTITHRVIGISTNGISPSSFQTKGDANAAADMAPVAEPSILGRVAWHIPFLGYLLAAVQTTLGLILLVVIPVTVMTSQSIRGLRRRWQEGQYRNVFHAGPPLVTRYDA